MIGVPGNLGLDERRERLLPALSFVRNVATQIEQPLARVIVIERLVETCRGSISVSP